MLHAERRTRERYFGQTTRSLIVFPSFPVFFRPFSYSPCACFLIHEARGRMVSHHMLSDQASAGEPAASRYTERARATLVTHSETEEALLMRHREQHYRASKDTVKRKLGAWHERGSLWVETSASQQQNKQNEQRQLRAASDREATSSPMKVECAQTVDYTQRATRHPSKSEWDCR